MKKFKLGVIFGGMSTEHEVSISSATSIIKNLDKEKYLIFPIYINKDGIWHSYTKDINEIELLNIGQYPKELKKIDKIFDYLENLDIVFPVLHGLYGEDGSIQGLLKLLKIPYVGCNILSSSICMDKAYCKMILEKAGIKQSKFIYLKKYKDYSNFILFDKEFNSKVLNLENIVTNIINSLNLPVFVKPANSGSSIGISKAHNINELKDALSTASKYDEKIIVEESIDAIDMECSVLGNKNVITSCVGEVVSNYEFYSFNAKYKSDSKIIIPARISEEQSKKIQAIAVKAYKAVDAKGLARIDFLIDKISNEIYLCEINTLPGFTNISMYPKLFENSGISYSELLDKLILLGLNQEI